MTDSRPTENEILIARSFDRLQEILKRDTPLRETLPLPSIWDELKTCKASIHALKRICELYSSRPALGFRTIVGGEPSSDFKTLSYQNLWEKVGALASGFRERNIIQEKSFVGLLGFPGPEYIISDFACLYLGAVAVPLQTTYKAKELQDILIEGEFQCLICHPDQLNLAGEVLPECPALKSVVIMGSSTLDILAIEDFRRRFPKHVVETVAQIESLGRTASPAVMSLPAEGDNPLRSLCYTSGSTGSPKGAMFPENLWLERWTSPAPKHLEGVPLITINYLPLSHMIGRSNIINTMKHGGATYFTLKSDMSSLFEDIQKVKPTYLHFVPRIAEMIFQLREVGPDFLGDRLYMIYTSGAPISDEVKAFLTKRFNVPVLESYGCTECSNMLLENKVMKQNVLDYKLVSIPELNYTTTDKPYPRGELHVKTVRAIKGYFKNPKASADLFDSEGFVKTGDIFEQRGPDHLVWLERKNSLIKLSQGEYVGTSHLENIYTSGKGVISQAYIYGNSQRSYLLGVFVPQKTNDLSEGDLKNSIRQEINRLAQEHNLLPHEVPRDFIVEESPFSRDNRLLTDAGKPSRVNLKKKYEGALEELYEKLESQQSSGMAALEKIDPQLPLKEKVRRAIEAVLGLKKIDWSQPQKFRDLGGDSLAAVTLVGLIEKLCNVSLSISVILNPKATLQAVVEEVESLRRESIRVSFRFIHGRSPQTIEETALRLKQFLSVKENVEARKVKASPLPQEPKNFFLTGANGFLGRFLCLDLMERAQRSGGKVYCLIRAENDAEAMARLQSVYQGDAQLQKRFNELADHLTVLAGDLEKSKMGLPAETYENLAKNVDLIFHAAALVNHAMSYEHLFGPNVLGTVEVMRLALKHRRKYLNYVSSTAVAFGFERSRIITETEDVRDFKSNWTLPSKHAEGYYISKWAGEVLARDLFEQFDIPVNVFRADLILPHSHFQKQVNNGDFFVRLLCSLVYTGVAPKSFYKKSSEDVAHFDGLPVDFVASALSSIACHQLSEYSTYQVNNIHWKDGISLDSFVEWIETSGYKLQRLDHENWFEEFSRRLKNLKPEMQRNSSLPIVNQWQNPAEPGDRQNIDASQFRKMVQSLKPAGATDIPHLSEKYIHKCLKDLVDLGIIEGPSVSNSVYMQSKEK